MNPQCPYCSKPLQQLGTLFGYSLVVACCQPWWLFYRCDGYGRRLDHWQRCRAIATAYEGGCN